MGVCLIEGTDKANVPFAAQTPEQTWTSHPQLPDGPLSAEIAGWQLVEGRRDHRRFTIAVIRGVSRGSSTLTKPAHLAVDESEPAVRLKLLTREGKRHRR